jgi:hypothetical protein
MKKLNHLVLETHSLCHHGYLVDWVSLFFLCCFDCHISSVLDFKPSGIVQDVVFLHYCPILKARNASARSRRFVAGIRCGRP